MNNIKPYTKYKPSGIAWLGNIPEHWTEFKPKTIGYLFGGLSGKSGDDFKIENEINISPYIPFTNIANNFIIDKRQLAYVKTLENEKQNIVRKNDLLFLMSSENFEDIGKTSLLNDEIEGLYLNSFCKGFRITDENFYPKFLNYLFLADVNRKRLSIQARGFTRINLKIGKVNDLAMFAPQDKNEQTAIANFLDYKTAKIDRFIFKKKQLIKLLNEQKAGIINDAVTKGLNPNTKTKPSGIEWLGDIPEHWEVRKLKYVAKICNGSDCDKQPEGKYPVYGSGGIFGWNENYIYDKPSVLLGRKGTVDKPILVNEPFWTVDTAFYTKIKTETIDVLFFYYLCCNIPFGFYGSKTALPSMTQTSLYEVKFGIPPLPEQTAIVSHIEKETAIINKTIATIEKEIALVQEYRTAIIAEVVTGKIDVRGYEFSTIEEETYEELEEELDIAAEEDAEFINQGAE
jgi:type I restriction enzyme S subunit